MLSVYEIKTMEYIELTPNQYLDVVYTLTKDPIKGWDCFLEKYPGLQYLTRTGSVSYLFFGNRDSLRALKYDMEKRKFADG